MRATVAGLAVASLVAFSGVSAQETAAATSTARRDSAQGTPSANAAASVDTLHFGGRTVRTGERTPGPVLVIGGDLRIQGTVQGAAVVIAGDIRVDSGGVVEGDAIAVLGHVHASDAAVRGTARSFVTPWTTLSSAPAAPRPVERVSTRGALELAVGWMFVMLILGIGVLVFAGGYVEGVADVLEKSFWRSFGWGIAFEIALLPAVILLVAALAVTIVGILLIPFAVVAYVLAAAGLITLGFLAMAKMTGEGFRAGAAGRLSTRGRSLRGMVVGVLLYMGLWIVASAFQWSPVVSGILRAVAMAVTFVAATAGFGAAILSRGGTRRDAALEAPEPAEMVSWQTPTPITGVVAARRPTPARGRERV